MQHHPFSSSNPPLLLVFLFPSSSSSFLLDYSTFLPLKVQAAHSTFTPSLSLYPPSLQFRLPTPSLHQSLYAPSLAPAAHSKANSTEGKNVRRGVLQCFPVISVLIELFSTQLHQTKHHPHSPATYSIPLLFMAIFSSFLFVLCPLGGKAGVILNLKGFISK